MAKKVSSKKKGAGTTKKKVEVKKLTPKNDVKIEPKNTSKNTAINTPKIDKTIIEKEDNNVVENNITREETPKNTSENDVLSMLRIPVVDSVEKEDEKIPEKEPAPEFENGVLTNDDDPFFGNSEEDPFANERQRENLNSQFDEYENMDEDGDGDFMFSDHVLMAEMGVEIIDLLMTTGAMAIAKDFGNEEKYSVSDYRKSKLKKPLAMLLEKKGKTLPPEVMFILVIIGVYAPVMMTAMQERQRKNAEDKQKKKDKIDQETPKKKGRPKGSKDSKPRKPKTIEIK
jgi:hypothetical protein